MIPHGDEEFRDIENATDLELAALMAEIDGRIAVLKKKEMKLRKGLKWIIPIWLIVLSVWMIGVSLPHTKFAWGVLIIIPCMWILLWDWVRAGGIVERDK